MTKYIESPAKVAKKRKEKIKSFKKKKPKQFKNDKEEKFRHSDGLDTQKYQKWKSSSDRSTWTKNNLRRKRRSGDTKKYSKKQKEK